MASTNHFFYCLFFSLFCMACSRYFCAGDSWYKRSSLHSFRVSIATLEMCTTWKASFFLKTRNRAPISRFTEWRGTLFFRPSIVLNGVDTEASREHCTEVFMDNVTAAEVKETTAGETLPCINIKRVCCIKESCTTVLEQTHLNRATEVECK